MLKRRIALLLSTSLLSACSSMVYQQARQQVKATTDSATQLNQKAAQPLPKADMAPIQVNKGVYLGAHVEKRQSGQSLPDSVERDGVRLVSAAPQDLQSIGDLLTQATGIPVSFSADVFAADQAAQANAAAAAMQSLPGMQLTVPSSADSLAAALNQALPKSSPVAKNSLQPAVYAGAPAGSSHSKMRVNYHGSLSGFLNLTAAYFDIGWSYSDGRLQFSRQVTRTFQLAAMPTAVDSSTSLTAGLSGGSGGDGGGISAGASQNASVKVKLDFWKDLNNTLKTIIGKDGSFSTSESGASVTVTAPASTVERVARQIQALNRQLLRQVTVKVQIYSVKLNQQSAWQYSLKGALNFGRLAIGGFGNGTAIDSASGMSTVLTAPATGGALGGSENFLGDLEKQGDVSVVTSAAVTTMSGQPVPLQVSNTQGYVSSVSTQMGVGGSSTSIETSQVNTGFSLNVLPKVMDDGKVLLQYSINISSLVGPDNGFTNMTEDKYQLQLPNVDQRSFIQEGLIPNGATLVLAGYEKVNTTAGENGVGKASFKLLGGGRNSQNARDVLVICITPVVLDHSVDLVGYN